MDEQILTAASYLVGLLSSFALILGLALLDDRRGGALPASCRPSDLSRWINDSRHWHNLGHSMFGFAVTCVSFALIALGASAWMAAAKTFGCLGGRWFLALNYAPLLGVGLCALPTLASTLCIELGLQGHWRMLLGQDPDWRDSLWDMAGHLSGAVCACMCLLSFLELFRYAKLLAAINLLFLGKGPLA